MQPDLEVIQIGRGESFRAWEHGYPYPTVRWHFHPEYELHHVVATSGRYFVGDFIGAFAPGNLVLTGPNLPHNWISDIEPNAKIPLRNRILQFSDEFIRGAMAILPELQCFSTVLEKSRSGILFSKAASADVAPLLGEIVAASGIRRVALFIEILGALVRDDDAQLLTTAEYLPDPSTYMSKGLNSVLEFINKNLTEPFTETDLAAIAGMNRTTLSRTFRKHTGFSFVQYVSRLRINLACQLLMSEDGIKVADVCFASGFNNLSNFNRQFVKQKSMTPSRFRELLMERISPVHGQDRSRRAA
jgi:AraC-like DNA-binding protein